jgi:hypothetical protein
MHLGQTAAILNAMAARTTTGRGKALTLPHEQVLALIPFRRLSADARRESGPHRAETEQQRSRFLRRFPRYS